MPDTAHQVRETRHFVQWIRVLLTSLVVALHAAQPYGPTGGAWPVSDPVNSDALLPVLAVNAAFLMGFFFFIAAYFLEGSYLRKGAWGFLKGRLIRLGVPLVVFVLLLHPLRNWLAAPGHIPFPAYLRDTLGAGQLDYDHLWFLGHLLVYALLYVAWRAIAGPPSVRPGP